MKLYGLDVYGKNWNTRGCCPGHDLFSALLADSALEEMPALIVQIPNWLTVSPDVSVVTVMPKRLRTKWNKFHWSVV